MFHWVRNNPLFAIIIWSNLKVSGLSLLALSVDTCIICVNHTQCFFYFLGCILTLQKLYSYILCRRGVGGGGADGSSLNYLNKVSNLCTFYSYRVHSLPFCNVLTCDKNWQDPVNSVAKWSTWLVPQGTQHCNTFL